MLSNGRVFSFLLLSSYVFVATEANNKSYHIPSIRANWFKANEFCNSLQMRLVTIKSQEENDAVARFVRSTDKFSDDHCTFWLGASDLAEEGRFIWVSTGERVTYSNWRPNEPNDNKGSEDCVHMEYNPSLRFNWQWNDNDCERHSLYFICENIETSCVCQF